ncbi:unnamed protein product [Coccothraustes coccothraustes]
MRYLLSSARIPRASPADSAPAPRWSSGAARPAHRSAKLRSPSSTRCPEPRGAKPAQHLPKVYGLSPPVATAQGCRSPSLLPAVRWRGCGSGRSRGGTEGRARPAPRLPARPGAAAGRREKAAAVERLPRRCAGTAPPEPAVQGAGRDCALPTTAPSGPRQPPCPGKAGPVPGPAPGSRLNSSPPCPARQPPSGRGTLAKLAPRNALLGPRFPPAPVSEPLRG